MPSTESLSRECRASTRFIVFSCHCQNFSKQNIFILIANLKTCGVLDPKCRYYFICQCAEMSCYTCLGNRCTHVMKAPLNSEIKQKIKISFKNYPQSYADDDNKMQGRSEQVKNLVLFSRFKYIILFSVVFTIKTF